LSSTVACGDGALDGAWPPELSGRLVVDNIGDPADHAAHIVAELLG
jgi:hypothetical protein